MQIRWLALFLAVTFAWSQSATAVVINSATGTGNTNAPADDPGWLNIGFLGVGTGIYLGEGWVLTASHVGAGTISLAGVSYAPLAGTTVQLTNNSPGKTAFTDLIMFRLASTPAGLGTLTLASSAPTLGTPVTMIGAGRDRGAFTKWNVNTGTTPWTWTEVPSGGNAAGYQTLSTRTVRWGTNTIASQDVWINVPGSSNTPVDVKTFATTFTDLIAAGDEAQASFGDSGGAVFAKNGSSWELGGVMIAIGGFSGQPTAGETPVYGNLTYSADISSYASQIMSIIPEPSTYALLGFSAAALIFACRRARRKD
jgi:hypothetical protein